MLHRSVAEYYSTHIHHPEWQIPERKEIHITFKEKMEKNYSADADAEPGRPLPRATLQACQSYKGAQKIVRKRGNWGEEDPPAGRV